MQLSDFDFELPSELIAQVPAQPRDHARLLVYERITGNLTDDLFYNIEKHLVAGTTLAINDSKVEKCRLKFGNTEIFVLETINPTTLRAMVRPGKKFQSGKFVDLEGIRVETVEVDSDGFRLLKLDRPLDDISLDQYRLTPLPPYIAQNESLAEEYQTVYANPLGSKAAPTAGLHFTDNLLQSIADNHPIAKVTLHVGLGTFAPVKTDIDKHVMHSEYYSLDKDNADILNKASHITAVGSTTARTLETIGRPFRADSNLTNIFIKPGYKFNSVDSLVTNFHLPKSTLLMLVAAHIGSINELQRVYQHAITNNYRFYSFGDAMLIK